MKARQRLKRDKIEDWHELSEGDLLRKLIERKVINEGESGDGAVSQSSLSFIGVCRNCLDTQSEQQHTNGATK